MIKDKERDITMIAATKKVIKVLMITREIIQSRNPTSELTNANKTQFYDNNK